MSALILSASQPSDLIADDYRTAGIVLEVEGTPLSHAPCWTRSPGVSWSDDEFTAGRWTDRAPNPAKGDASLAFEGFSPHHAWTARFFLWALEHAETGGAACSGQRPRSLARSAGHLSTFRALTRFASSVGCERLIDLTPSQIEMFMTSRLGLSGSSTGSSSRPKAKAFARQILSTLRRLYELGPRGDRYVPDGLAFDPQSKFSWMISHPDLKHTIGTRVLDEEEARRIVGTAVEWVETYGDAAVRLVAMADEFASWLDGSGLKGISPPARVVRYLDERPKTLADYSELRIAFPKPVDVYYQEFLGVPPMRDAGPGYAAIERLKLRELERVAGLSENGFYENGFLEDEINREWNDVVGITDAGIAKAIVVARREIASSLSEKSIKLPMEWRNMDRNSPAVSNEGLAAYSDFLRIRKQAASIAALTTGMCYIVFAVFGGWRISEITSVEAGDLRTVAAGHLIGSRVRKTSASPNATAERPVPPVVAAAYDVLHRMNVNRFGSKEKRLFRNVRGNAANATSITVALGAALDPMGLPAQVRSHQFRRFFAYFYLRRYKGNIDALRRQFRHVSREMVWAYAKDAANAQHLVREEKALAGEIVDGLVHGKGYAARHVGRDLRARFRGTTLPPAEAERWLRRKISDRYRSVHPSEFGYCLFQHGDVGAACEADEKPVLARAAPSTCGTCKFHVTGEENLGFWQGIALLHQEILDCEHHAPILKEASRSMLRVCADVLKRHETIRNEGTGRE